MLSYRIRKARIFNSAQSGVELSISPGISLVQNVVFSSAFGFSRKWTKVLVRIGSGGIL